MNPDRPHPREEEAIAYAFGLMEEAARPEFEAALKSDAALRALVSELQGTAAGLAFDAPQQAAPADLRPVILNSASSVQQERVLRTPVIAKSEHNPWKWATLAAGIALLGLTFASFMLFKVQRVARETEAETLSRQIAVLKTEVDGMKEKLLVAVQSSTELKKTFEAQLAAANNAAEALRQDIAQRTKREDELKHELAKLTQTNELAKMQIATLQSSIKEYQQGVAVVVWNSDTQQGILKLEKMPPVEQGKDYQLWVVDPAKPKPVNAGVVQVDDKGFAKVEFKPVVEIDKASNFAISVEKEGGAAENEGPIILLSP